MCRGIERLQGKYDLVGSELVAKDSRYLVGNVTSDSLVISFNAQGSAFLSAQLELYRTASVLGIPVLLMNWAETARKLLLDIEEKDSLLKQLLEVDK